MKNVSSEDMLDVHVEPRRLETIVPRLDAIFDFDKKRHGAALIVCSSLCDLYRLDSSKEKRAVLKLMCLDVCKQE